MVVIREGRATFDLQKTTHTRRGTRYNRTQKKLEEVVVNLRPIMTSSNKKKTVKKDEVKDDKDEVKDDTNVYRSPLEDVANIMTSNQTSYR